MRKKLLIPLLFSAVMALLISCSGPAEQSANQPSPTIEAQAPTATETGSPEPTASVEITPVEATPETPASPSPLPQATSTEDTRPLPEDWRTWPIVPTLSPAMIEVYQQGLAMGNRDNAFSKVGDCQIIPEAFLGLFDDPNYVLPERIKDLQDTLDHFQGSFAREGYSLKGGFVFPTVFSPLRADKSVCNPGETPLECELRVHKPSFVLIAMEFRYEGRTAEIHEKYLRRAVEFALSRGIVPILATKADNVEGDHSLNLKTVQIAYEYDLPLWNFWRAVQVLPYHGLAPKELENGWGFHTTQEAWLMRSETFLQVLDALYHQAQGIQ